MANLLIIGAGGVSQVASIKCAMNSDTFTKITLASRTKSKCDKIASIIKERCNININTAQIDADDTQAVVKLIKESGAEILLNLALPYQDLSLMDACLQAKIHYIDTANYEHPSLAKFEYKEQWARNEKFKESGILGLLGSGFDPGVTNVFCAYAQQNLFDEIHFIDILDCNAGDHGYAFATNFNPEINLREVSANGRYWQEGKWIETKPMQISMSWDYPEVGPKDSYLLYHEELESLVKNIKGLKRIRFFMTFSQSYLTHMKCLENVGMLGIKPVLHQGQEIIPIEFLKTLLPDPASLGARTKGFTNIGCVIRGVKNGQDKQIYIYNVCNHEECYKETLSQAVSYTTGVPAMIGAKLVAKGIWQEKGVFNMENFDAKPFMDELNSQGLPWKIIDMKPSLGF
ncbi:MULTISPECIES: saccharopine dehydrogenase family protein [unclassified Campylobacter]|uniref:saccharopine dehydrogenase family protein n=1 Tax=unclassified Campylobacter TaxID=2593542 RepID=UPI001237D8CF|nr:MULTISPECIES: saccharopine dehydrogenase family protein [unclassified Campylobacter]KAA6225907.1 saccharopine dehydrogenase family protein [Campylobacter sp. LR196d]KAA6226988.1 saccharopine dehydrogenase family protein [Campylobacter sp. LR185c]KAA6228862.1 saccharopine dehydrogenase family protein [Campylobacter sp. LR286c]KAA6233437.1 saccharopine dehydrogenase family protein [Campylobacter sp. LR291e]KAA8603569.1 saccharopine dehydrogenase [Campylobacter sp. LR185c]